MKEKHPKKRRIPKPQPVRPYNQKIRAIVLGMLIVGVGFGALVYKLYQLQIVQGNELKTAANAQHIFLLGRQNVLFLWVNRYDMS